MSTAAVRGVIRQLGLDDPPTDATLLTRYARLRDNAAFAELLRRHGPVVLGVCRRVLADPHDAEDAFQAVFLVLARKAGTVRPPGMVGSWLYGVAVRTANKAKVAAARRWRREMAGVLATPDPASPDGPVGGELERTELRAVIDDELGRLPDPLRAPVVLCDIGGKTRAEAARELGCPEGTVAARLHRARKLLADRLTRRGVTVPAAGVGAVLTPEVGSAAVSPVLTQTTLAAAGAFAAGTPTPAVSPTVQALAEGVLRAMTTGKFKLTLAALLSGGLLAGAFWGVSAADPRPTPTNPMDAKPEPPPTPKPRIPNDGYIWNVQFRPDGTQYLVTTSAGVRVHDAATGRLLFTIPGMSAGYSADGRSLFVMGDQGRVYDPDTGKVTREFPRPKVRFEWHLVGFSPDGRGYVAFDGTGHQLRDTATGFEPVRLDGKLNLGGVMTPTGKAAFFSSDGKRVIGLPVESRFAPGGPGVGVWDAATGDLLGVIGGITSDAPLAVAISPDGKQIATGHAKNVRLWDAATFKELKNLGDTPGSGPVTALAFSPDGKTLAVAFRKPIFNGADLGGKPQRVDGYKTELQLLNLATGKELKRFDGFEGVSHTAPTALPVVALAFSPDGTKLAAGAGILPSSAVPAGSPKTGEVKVFSLTGREITDAPAAAAGPWREKGVLTDTAQPIVSVAFAPDGKTFAAGGSRQDVVIWSAPDLKRVFWFNRNDIQGGPAAVAYTPDGRNLAHTLKDGVALHDLTTWKTTRMFEEKGAAPTALAFGPEGDVQGHKRGQLAFTDGQAVWAKSWIDDAPEGTAKFGPLAGAPKLDGPPPAGVAYSPDGKQLVFIPNRKMDPTWPDGKRDVLKPDPQKDTHWIAQIWGAGSGAPMQFLKHGTDPVTAVGWSPDGKLVATGGADGVVALWDPASGKEVRRFKLGGGGEGRSTVHAIAFAPDGKTLAAAVEYDEGKNARRVVLLDLPTGARVQDLQSFATAPPVAIAFSPDGKTLVVGCGVREADVRNPPDEAMKQRGEVRVFTTEPEKKPDGRR